MGRKRLCQHIRGDVLLRHGGKKRSRRKRSHIRQCQVGFKGFHLVRICAERGTRILPAGDGGKRQGYRRQAEGCCVGRINRKSGGCPSWDWLRGRFDNPRTTGQNIQTQKVPEEHGRKAHQVQSFRDMGQGLCYGGTSQSACGCCDFRRKIHL